MVLRRWHASLICSKEVVGLSPEWMTAVGLLVGTALKVVEFGYGVWEKRKGKAHAEPPPPEIKDGEPPAQAA